jgi:hypothetical protein
MVLWNGIISPHVEYVIFMMAKAEGKPVLMSKHRAVLAYKGNEGTAPQIIYVLIVLGGTLYAPATLRRVHTGLGPRVDQCACLFGVEP